MIKVDGKYFYVKVCELCGDAYNTQHGKVTTSVHELMEPANAG